MRTESRFTFLLMLALPVGAAAQVLTPAEALARAEQRGFANRIAAGQAGAQAGQAMLPLRGILPSVRVEASYLKTTDPLNAFGFLLRQRAITPAAFNPTLLNDPNSIGNVSTGLVVEQPLFNADAWLGRRTAGDAAGAMEASARWTRSGTSVLVLRAYWGAVLAAEQVNMLEVAATAGRAHVREAELVVQQGLATRSDALLARVKAGEIEARLVAARGEARIARRGLAVLMGDPADTSWTLPDTLPSSAAVTARAEASLTEDAAPAERADVQAASLGARAARADRRRAQSLYLPRLNGFGRVDWNDPNQPFAGKSAWTVGVMLSWSPFAGASELAELKATGGRLQAAEAMADAAEGQAALELAQATERLTVAREQLAIQDVALAQAREAHRLVTKKYAGGLSSITELFDATAAETGAALAHAAARYDLLVAVAERQKAMGKHVD